MGDDVNSADEAEAYRWRPAVAPFRPGGIRRIRARRPLPGQMSLPGLESADEPAPTAEQTGDERRPDAAAEVPGGSSSADAPPPGLVCPHCGGTEFDEDGDCIRCWEPGVAPGNAGPRAEKE